MKLIKKTSLLIALLLLTTMVCFSPKTIYAEEQSTDNGTVLLGFESEKEIIATMMYGGINKSELSDKYVTEGKYSLRLCPVFIAEKGDDEFYDDSYVAIYNGSYAEKTKFLDCEYLSVDIYNPSATDYTMLWTVDGDYDKIYTLKPGWNTLYKYISRQTLKITANGNIGRMSLRFVGRKGAEGVLDLYIDNLKYYTTDVDYIQYESADNMLEKGFTFNDEADLRFFTYQGKILSEFSKPLYEINNDFRYCQSGNRSLKVTFRQDKNGMMDTIWFRTIDNILGDLSDYVGSENYYISTAIYNAYDYPISCTILLFSNYNDEVYGRTVEIAANSWSSQEDSRIYFNDMSENFTGTGLDIMTLCYYFNRITTPGSIYIDSINIKK